MTENEKGQERTLEKGESVNKGILESVNSQEVKLFGIFFKTSVWKQFAGKHAGLRITTLSGTDSVHKGLRRRIVLAQSIGWYKPQDQT